MGTGRSPGGDQAQSPRPTVSATQQATIWKGASYRPYRAAPRHDATGREDELLRMQLLWNASGQCLRVAAQADVAAALSRGVCSEKEERIGRVSVVVTEFAEARLGLREPNQAVHQQQRRT
ncbi:hypothetical protein MRX96_021361 [Rhipicephalus microplus]